MSKRIVFGQDEQFLHESIGAFLRSTYPMALTGAGISVESGIPDFRSPGGLWTVFTPDEYATIDVFLENPEHAWKLYRVLAEALRGKDPNDAHLALARLEKKGLLRGIITQNIDGLHERAGSSNIMLIHGNSEFLECIHCGRKIKAGTEHFSGAIPECGRCKRPLKPDYVLFGEPVRELDRIRDSIKNCDALLVIGTSCNVYPAAGFPAMVKAREGLVFEFNVRFETADDDILSEILGGPPSSDYFFLGNASVTVSRFVNEILAQA